MAKAPYKTTYFRRLARENWKVPLFYQFLQISPDYRMAYEHVVNGKKAPDHYDRDRLTETYRRFGDVWNLDLEKWWLKHGNKHLGTTAQPSVALAAKLTNLSLPSMDEFDLHHLKNMRTLGPQVGVYFEGQYIMDGFPDVALVAVPLNGDRETIQKQVRQVVDKAISSIPEKSREKSKISFLMNKTRRVTLEKFLFAVYEKAKAKDTDTLTDLGKDIAKKYPQRRLKGLSHEYNLKSQTSELLRKALNTTEWAAVSEFPKTTKHDRLKMPPREDFKNDKPYNLSFDMPFIREQIQKGNILGN